MIAAVKQNMDGTAQGTKYMPRRGKRACLKNGSHLNRKGGDENPESVESWNVRCRCAVTDEQRCLSRQGMMGIEQVAGMLRSNNVV